MDEISLYCRAPMQQKILVWSWLKFVQVGPLSLATKDLEKSEKQSNRKSATDS